MLRMPSMSVIQTRDLRRTFQTRGSTVEAVAGVDLRVEAGEVFGFLGPNGAGKTTTLRMLSTLLPHPSGRAEGVGCAVLRERGKARQRIGYVGQRSGSAPGVSARRELEFQARVYGTSAAEARKRTRELLGLLELEACAD